MPQPLAWHWYVNIQVNKSLKSVNVQFIKLFSSNKFTVIDIMRANNRVSTHALVAFVRLHANYPQFPLIPSRKSLPKTQEKEILRSDVLKAKMAVTR